MCLLKTQLEVVRKQSLIKFHLSLNYSCMENHFSKVIFWMLFLMLWQLKSSFVLNLQARYAVNSQ